VSRLLLHLTVVAELSYAPTSLLSSHEPPVTAPSTSLRPHVPRTSTPLPPRGPADDRPPPLASCRPLPSPRSGRRPLLSDSPVHSFAAAWVIVGAWWLRSSSRRHVSRTRTRRRAPSGHGRPPCSPTARWSPPPPPRRRALPACCAAAHRRSRISCASPEHPSTSASLAGRPRPAHSAPP